MFQAWINLLLLNQKTAFTTQTRIMTFSSCKSHQPTQPDGISLPSIQCSHAKVSALHDYKSLMFNWLYRTLKQAEGRTLYQNESSRKDFLSFQWLIIYFFIKNLQLILIEFDVLLKVYTLISILNMYQPQTLDKIVNL